MSISFNSAIDNFNRNWLLTERRQCRHIMLQDMRSFQDSVFSFDQLKILHDKLTEVIDSFDNREVKEYKRSVKIKKRFLKLPYESSTKVMNSVNFLFQRVKGDLKMYRAHQEKIISEYSSPKIIQNKRARDLEELINNKSDLFDDFLVLNLFDKATLNLRFDIIRVLLKNNMLEKLGYEDRNECIAALCDSPNSVEYVPVEDIVRNYDGCSYEKLIDLIKEKKSGLIVNIISYLKDPYLLDLMLKKIDPQFALNFFIQDASKVFKLSNKFSMIEWLKFREILPWFHEAGAKITMEELQLLSLIQDYKLIEKLLNNFQGDAVQFALSDSDETIFPLLESNSVKINLNLLNSLSVCDNKDNEKPLSNADRINKIIFTFFVQKNSATVFNQYVINFFKFLRSQRLKMIKTSNEAEVFIKLAQNLKIQPFIIKNIENRLHFLNGLLPA